MKGNSQAFGGIALVVALVAATVLVYSVSHLLPPIVLGLLLGYVVYPLIRLLSRIGLPKGLGVLMVFTLFVSGIVYSGSILAPLVKSEIDVLTGSQSASVGESRIYDIINDTSDQLYRYRLIKENLDAQQLIDQLRDFLRQQSRLFVDSVGGVAAQAGQFLMIFLFVFTYTLLDGHKIHRTIIGFIPNPLFEPGTLMLRETTVLFGAYLRGLIIENTLLGLFAFLMLAILRVFVPLSMAMCILIALTIALTNVIRIVGPFIGATISVIFILLSEPDLIAIVGVVLIVVAIQILDNIFVLPLIMKEQVDVHPVVSLLSVIAGGSIGGILGMIIAIPVAGAIKILFHIFTVERKRFQLS